MTNIPELSIVIPVFNEADIIERTLDECLSKVNLAYQLYIVYDFPEDNTIPVVRNYISSHHGIPTINLVHNDYGKGVLNAIKKGIDTVQSDYILISMGDLSDDLSIVNDMFELMESGYDVVSASRYMPGGKQIGGEFIKKGLSYFGGISLHYLTGIPTRDISNNFKMYRSSFVQSLDIQSTGGFEIGLEILVKAWIAKQRITEIPTIWKDRTAGESNFKLFSWLPKYLRWYLLAIWTKIKGR